MLVEYGVWAARSAVAVVFGLSAYGKLVDRSGTRTAVAEFGIPVRWAPAVSWALPLAEAAIAVAVLPPWTAAVAALAGTALLLVFTTAVIGLLRRGKRPACSCFGATSTTPIGRTTVLRNALLIALTVAAAAGSFAHPRVPQELSADRAVGTVLAAALAAPLIRLTGEVRALRRRLDEQALSTLGAEGLPVGALAPEFELLDTRGGRVGLEKLLASGRHLLLVFVHPACELCAALARELPRWQARAEAALSIVVVGNGEVAEHAAWGSEQRLGEIPVLVQQGNEAALRYRVRGTPSGVLIGADGRVLAPVARGAMSVRELVVTARTVPRA
ncbi:redoxin domain-containing protein [Nocardia terpenica]|uniref:MauE/DoxX family redox-associated membrane protein n=1 Tax=Nocardia terpenica TaxID=455432 RepID=UPI001894FE4E|nr:MauE/DoxX family redox-associated membrane protein [Nocardia terpenica]MBF6065108.1 redoxin domain-containing protein [Nocardia terpenica]MBF6108165.1 redoxin domain-containing protein [Nocardia terpenica]MBF6115380.1 redoxin domain-containing protein [Nocardia terpenica]MBF6122702.1 redoxin domain-containing protein [Nocardia terpenica]MBF6157264.1 redoxin domain-containing protein [Nocardia terpenica]